MEEDLRNRPHKVHDFKAALQIDGRRRLGFYCLGCQTVPHSACGFAVERVERSLSPQVHSFDGGHATLAVDYFDFKHHLYVL